MAAVALRRSEKQREIVGIVLREASAGNFLCVSEIYDRLSYKSEATYGALRLSLRILVERGILAKKRDGQRTLIIPTSRAYELFVPQT